MKVEEESVETPKAVPWWRQGWVWLAVTVLAAEVGTVQLLSARGTAEVVSSRLPQTRYWLYLEPGESAKADAWSLMVSPAVMLVPSEQDFSGSSWLAGPTAEVALEAFLARVQPLPFEPIRGGAGGLPAFPRIDPGPGSRWDVPEGMGPLPGVAPVAVPEDGRVRILEGLEGWELAKEIKLEPFPGGLLAQRAVVRLMVDDSGTPASPPVIWEGSGEAVADAAALGVVRTMRLIRSAPILDTKKGVGGWKWGLVSVTWPAPRVESAGEGGPRP